MAAESINVALFLRPGFLQEKLSFLTQSEHNFLHACDADGRFKTRWWLEVVSYCAGSCHQGSILMPTGTLSSMEPSTKGYQYAVWQSRPVRKRAQRGACLKARGAFNAALTFLGGNFLMDTNNMTIAAGAWLLVDNKWDVLHEQDAGF